MQAMIYTQYGTPDVLHMADLPTPDPKPNEVRVKIHATTVNYGDLVARNFRALTHRQFNMPAVLWVLAKLAFGLRKPNNPILGSEFAGVVDAVGANVTRFAVGDAVFGYSGQSMRAYAEYLCMPETGSIAHKPTHLSDAEATAIPYGAIMAWGLLQKANIQAGQKVLINGASGSIGTFALLIAKHHYGAQVTGVASTGRLDYLRALGADAVLDYTRTDYTEGDERYDVILDILGRSSFAQAQRVLQPNGRMIYASFKFKQVWQMLGRAGRDGKRVLCVMASESGAVLETIRAFIETHHIHPVLDRTYPLAQAPDAHRHAESGQAAGHVVLVVG